MTKQAIIEALAREHRIEQMCCAIAHERTLTADMKDLAQTVYLVLLEYDEEKIVDLWNSGALGFFIARIIINQYRTRHSPFHDTIRRFRSLSEELRNIHE